MRPPRTQGATPREDAWPKPSQLCLPEGAIVADEGNTEGLSRSRCSAPGAPAARLAFEHRRLDGLGLPLATGAAVACPDRKVICLEGDGSAMYTLQALWTQARESLNVVNLILVNRSLPHPHRRIGTRRCHGRRRARAQLARHRPPRPRLRRALARDGRAGRARRDRRSVDASACARRPRTRSGHDRGHHAAGLNCRVIGAAVRVVRAGEPSVTPHARVDIYPGESYELTGLDLSPWRTDMSKHSLALVAVAPRSSASAHAQSGLLDRSTRTTASVGFTARHLGFTEGPRSVQEVYSAAVEADAKTAKITKLDAASRHRSRSTPACSAATTTCARTTFSPPTISPDAQTGAEEHPVEGQQVHGRPSRSRCAT